MNQDAVELRRTPLHALHVELGARMGPFAGYDMPIQYPTGILAEHAQTRTRAGLFDVSHMGQALLDGPDHETTARALETLCAADVVGLSPGRQRYTQLLNAEGGIVDDLMATRPEGHDGRLFLVVNAARKEVDFERIGAALPQNVRLAVLSDRALIALQGPMAERVLIPRAPRGAIEQMKFMTARALPLGGVECHVSRSGYTGEDGFEISLPADRADAFARALIADSHVAPIGLGARDSLRLEAGLCLYGHELDETIDPVEAGLSWSIGKRRRIEGGFPGFQRISAALTKRPQRYRVGVKLEGRAPAREGADIVDAAGQKIGVVTSGGFGPSVGAAIAMGYVPRQAATPGTLLGLVVRGRILPGRVSALPFHPHAYKRD